MTFRPLKLAAVSLCALSLAGCADMSSSELTGTILGGALGGLAGAQFGHHGDQALAIGLGVALGAYVGHEIGHSLDERERAAHERAARRALWDNHDNHSASWGVPRGASGQVTPTGPAYTDGRGRRCRPFNETVQFADGRHQMVDGVACLNADGHWDVASM